VASTFEITGPNVDTEDATYVKVEVRPSVDSEWETPERRFSASCFPSETGSSFSIPVVPDSSDDDGTVIITFSEERGEWTRRVVQ
jgi:hypothetical protein